MKRRHAPEPPRKGRSQSDLWKALRAAEKVAEVLPKKPG